MLYPQSNKCRSVTNLNGVWHFKTVADDYVPERKADDFMLMPVPSSYNDIVTDGSLRDYVGCVLYETCFSVPIRKDENYRLRIGAVSHKCKVYLNGERIGDGINGFFPIDLPLSLREENRLSVVIDNRLTFQTLPVGKIENGKQIINHDFYNFTGIHRDVLVYSVPDNAIGDIIIKTVVGGDYSAISVKTKTGAKNVLYTVKDKNGNIVAKSDTSDIRIENPIPWNTENPYLYTLTVETENDAYEEKFGIRKVEVRGKEFLLNDKPVYFKGYGMHEDFFVFGKGNNTAVNIRDFELLKWTNANSFRTSHYPYSEEMMNLADEYGMLVIDEVPAVGMNWWGEGCFSDDKINDETRALHKELIRRLVERDKNHPSVVMLSVANEAATSEDNSRPYFEDVINYARKCTDLPITIVEFTKFDDGCKVGDLVDVIGLNRYYGWYTDHGNVNVVKAQMKEELCKYYEGFQKPIIVTEFGADTIEGLHSWPSETFSEEFQKEYIEENCKAFDECDFCIGEHVWNFADFKTKQGLTRIRGNRKGVFTKDRQPKLAAHFLKARWKLK